MFAKVKLYIGIALFLASIWGGWKVNNIFQKAKERDVLVAENKVLTAQKKKLGDSLTLEVKLFSDSLKANKALLAKALFETKNAQELYLIKKGTEEDFQGVIKIMRDSVIKINRDRVKLQNQVMELEKDLEKAKKPKRGLFR